MYTQKLVSCLMFTGQRAQVEGDKMKTKRKKKKSNAKGRKSSSGPFARRNKSKTPEGVSKSSAGVLIKIVNEKLH